MSSVALLQFGSGDYETMLKASRDHHRQMCAKFGYELRTEHCRKASHPFWEKPRMIKEALEKYDKVIWLDADSLWLRGDIVDPVREQDSCFAMTWHNQMPWDPHHFNAGVIYVNNTADARRLVDVWLNTSDDGHKWHDQWALMKVVESHGTSFRAIGHEWNSVEHIPAYKHPHPNVVAWHGNPGLAIEWIPRYIQHLKEIGE